jgi:uncharacterized protein with von Willebrand factor type A (vWA) domain
MRGSRDLLDNLDFNHLRALRVLRGPCFFFFFVSGLFGPAQAFLMAKTAPHECLPQRGLAANIVRFGTFLKAQGFRVFQSRVIEAISALDLIELCEREDVINTLRASLTSTDLEWRQFPVLFDAFFRGLEEEPGPDFEEAQPSAPEKEEGQSSTEAVELREQGGETCQAPDETEKQEWLEMMAYCPVSKVEKKDLNRFDRADVQVAELALKKLIEPFRFQPSRRRTKSRRTGEMDFPRVMRRSLRAGGFPFELFFRQRKRRLKRLVVIADVSGSMDRYARFVMPFLLGLRSIGPRAEVFVFSTSLTSITILVRHLTVEKALERISDAVPDWSGGTRIGYSLHQFNQSQGGRLLTRRTVVVILSDGWDLGGKEILKREMKHLRKKAHCVVWLNPLAGDPDYQPTCQGMKVAMPYVDFLLPAKNLENLKQVGRVLSKVMTH